MAQKTVSDPVEIIAKSNAMQLVLEQIQHLQKAGSTNVLILGETGTGKELIARAIHQESPKKKGPFIPVNCASIPEHLVESTLFGHVQGAFTGASTTRKGYFELAHQGSLFFDEIGDMPLNQQVKLLRVLEDRRFMSVGGHEEKSSDVRVIAATNARLENKMHSGLFRQDLYYRLATFTIFLPPLRERPEDIPELAIHFLHRLAEKMGRACPNLAPETLSALISHHFHGNIRELRNIIEHALILCSGKEIMPEHLPRHRPFGSLAAMTDPWDRPEANRSFGGHAPVFNHMSLPPDQMEFLLVQGALAQMNHDVQAAARLLNVSPLYIQMVCKKTGLPRAAPSSEEKILQYVCACASITNAECRALLETDIHRASYLLKKLYREGRLTREKGGRWTRYVLPDSIGS